MHVLIQDGSIVASVCGGGVLEERDEIMRYAEQYEEDGPVMVARVVYESEGQDSYEDDFEDDEGGEDDE